MTENQIPKFIIDQVNGLANELHGNALEKAISTIFAAWIRDRAEQYHNDSCCRCVFDELLEAIRNGEPWESYRHGELDDLMKCRAVAQPSLLRPAYVAKPPTPGVPIDPKFKPKGFT